MCARFLPAILPKAKLRSLLLPELPEFLWYGSSAKQLSEVGRNLK